MGYVVGADVGGTFTDFVVLDLGSGTARTLKVPSRPDDPASGVVEGLRRILGGEVRPEEIRLFVHGTTVGLNTLLQRAGARVGLLTTAGFRDVLLLRRLRLDDAPGYFASQPRPLVARRDIREVRGRLLADGTEVRPLEREDVLQGAHELLAAGCQEVAISFLHSYRNPAHERQAAAWIKDIHPQVPLTLSSEVWPQQREYERTQVTVIDAHLGPVMRGYFQNLEGSLRSLGISAPLFSTRSSGGIVSAARAAQRPVVTLMSGPASGVVAAAALGQQTGQEHLVAFDMGGTSADIGLVQDGRGRISTEGAVGEFPVIMPAVDVSSIGAGGGSIARVDATGLLKVGPLSAGADPGPACYGRGGTDCTLTDAYVTLGIIGPLEFLGGTIPLDAEAARRACAAVGQPLGLAAEDAAEAILKVTTATMYARLLPLMAQRGADPHEYALLAYGGAGPTHAFLLAAECGFARILVPTSPGTFCALGSVLADLRADFVRTVYRPLDQIAAQDLEEIFKGLEDEARQWVSEERMAMARPVIRLTADMRYVGQSYELTVDLDAPTDGFKAAMQEAFGRAHQEVYGYSEPGAPLDLVNARAHVLGLLERPSPHLVAGAAGGERGRRRIRQDGQDLLAEVVPRDGLGPGEVMAGPAVVTQWDTTTWVPPGYQVKVAQGGLLEGTRIG